MNSSKLFLVDSSKTPYWISRQAKTARKSGLGVKHVLIWKTPIEFALSRFKRGAINQWSRAWKSYYRQYFSSVDQWVSVSYSDLARDPKGTLKLICQAIDIDYFEGKEKYWQWEHHTLFGNNSAKVHLYDKNTGAYDNSKEWLNRVVNKEDSVQWDALAHRSITYDSEPQSKLPLEVVEAAAQDKEMQAIVDLLNATKVGTNRQERVIDQLERRLRYSGMASHLFMWHWRLKMTKRKILGAPEQLKKK